MYWKRRVLLFIMRNRNLLSLLVSLFEMTFRDRLENLIRTLRDASWGQTISCLFFLAILVLFLTGFCSNYWLKSSIVGSDYDYRNQGLWMYCYGSLETTCCGYINEVMYIERKLTHIFYFHGSSFKWKTIQTSKLLCKKCLLFNFYVFFFLAFLHATRAFLVISLLLQIACGIIIFYDIDKTCDEHKAIASALSGFSGISIS